MAYLTLHGIPVSRGIAIGRAHLLAPAALDVKHYLIPPDQVPSEVARLQAAIASVHSELRAIRADLPKDAPAELGAFLDVHALILSDPMISEMPLNIIRSRHYNAEWALVTQIDELSAQFDDIEDAYLRERRNDIRQVGERILKALTGSAAAFPAPVDGSDTPMIVVAHDISPADMTQFRNGAFSGFITDLGGQNSHTAIIARSLDIPAALGMQNASALIEQDDWVIIDGDAGTVIVDPPQEVMDQYRARQAELLRERKKLTRLRKVAAVTRDGTPITLMANIEFPEDCIAALEAGASGVGLFRSEFLFMGGAAHPVRMPTEEEQFDAYKRAVLAMKGRPVTIRTLDSGADKPLDEAEESTANPALGLRAIRYCLAQPEIFLSQLRAILRASAFGPIKLLLPLITHAFEIDRSLALIEQAKQQLRDAKHKFDPAIPIGAMIEVPAAALTLPVFVKRLDFLSVGTNDLIQYTLAIDRVDHEVAHLYSPLHPAVLYLLSNVISTAQRSGIPISVCGEMAGEPAMCRLLLGMGLREFSMHPSQIPAVKQEILNSDLDVLTAKTKKILRLHEPAEIARAVEELRAL
jgi:phosphotransferase system enzyme I (PtsI)